MLAMISKASSRTLLLVAVVLECASCMSYNGEIRQSGRPSDDTKANSEDAKADDTAVENALPDNLIDVQYAVLKKFLSEFKKGQVGINDPIDVKSILPSDTEPCTALQIAARTGNVELLKGLLKAGANPNASHNRDRETALHIAARRGQIEIVKVLIDAEGVDINQQASGNKTPLPTAISYAEKEVVRVLAQHEKIDFTKQDFKGRTPLRWAPECYFSKDDLVPILEENGAKN